MSTIGHGPWTERSLHAMGSPAHVIVGDADDALVDWALAELERLEQCWSRFRPDSELCGLNAAAGEPAPVAVSTTLLAALTRARELHATTAGAFDPTTLAALEAAGYDASFDELDYLDLRPLEPAVPAPGFGAVEIDEDAGTVRLPAGTRIDLGGIGKGLAADLVAQGLVDRGARTALVSLGGDLRACGEPPDPDGWPVPVEHPCDASRVAFVHALVNGGLVTSTTRIRAWERRGHAMHHIIDPRSGAPTTNGTAAVVVAGPTAWFAEGIAKAVIVLGVEEGSALVRRAQVDAWHFLDDGSILPVTPFGP